MPKVRGYHTVNNKTPMAGEYVGPGKHHVITTHIDDEGNAYVHPISKNFNKPKFDKDEVISSNRELDEINRKNWYAGKDQDIPTIPLSDIKANNGESIPLNNKSEVTSIAIKIPREELNESTYKTGFSEDVNNEIQEKILKKYWKTEEGDVMIDYYCPKENIYSTIKTKPADIGSFKPENYEEMSRSTAYETERILKNDNIDDNNVA